jgi:NAD(P)H-hydrate repair Nnr-like enzyme with NAD(P)H-hydrate epimerase domain
MSYAPPPLPPRPPGPAQPAPASTGDSSSAALPALSPPAQRWQRPASCTPGDPYLDWALATGWQGFPPMRKPADPALPWVPLLAPRGRALDQALARLGSSLWLNPESPPDTGWVTVWAQAGAVEAMRKSLRGCELSQPLPVDFARARAPSTPPARSGKPVPLILGSIDHGGAFLNAVFRAPGGSKACRILSYWDQAALPPQDPDTPWQVAPAGYGRELQHAALQALHRRCAGQAAKEQALYKALGLDKLLAAAAAEQPDHATHVLDTLAGLPARRRHPANAKPGALDAAAHAPLLLVSVPRGLDGQTTGAACVAQILDALHHILREAEALSPQAAVVVNISLGALAGPHDGSSALERAIDALMRKRPRLLVVFAAGNNGGDLLNDPTSGTNAAGVLAPRRSARLSWRLQPGDPTDSFLELWCSAEGGSAPPSKAARPALQLRVLEPLRSPWIKLDKQVDLYQGQRLLGRLQQQQTGSGRSRAQLSLAPVRGARGGLPAGRWLIELRNSGELPLNLEARVQGDLSRWTDPIPVQSVLVEAQGLQLGQAGSLNGLATGKLPLMVGAAHTEDDRDSLYTARLKPSDRERRLARAVADEGPLAYGLMAAGVLSGSEVRMGGTSVAAPVAARQWANRLARGGLPPRPEDWLDFLSAEEDLVRSMRKRRPKRQAKVAALRPQR